MRRDAKELYHLSGKAGLEKCRMQPSSFRSWQKYKHETAKIHLDLPSFSLPPSSSMLSVRSKSIVRDHRPLVENRSPDLDRRVESSNGDHGFLLRERKRNGRKGSARVKGFGRKRKERRTGWKARAFPQGANFLFGERLTPGGVRMGMASSVTTRW